MQKTTVMMKKSKGYTLYNLSFGSSAVVSLKDRFYRTAIIVLHPPYDFAKHYTPLHHAM